MKIHRFVTSLDTEGRILDKEVVHQIHTVLRLEPGEYIVTSDGNGNDQKGIIAQIDKNSILLENIEKVTPNVPLKKVTLYCAILKKENFELVCQKATELGVSIIVPIITERTIKQNIKIDRLEKINKEASEQAGLSVVPKLMPITNFKDAVQESIKNTETTILFDQSGQTLKNTYQNIGIFVGPEGGFTQEEIMYAKENGALITSIGNTTLRGETAAIVTTFWATQ